MKTTIKNIFGKVSFIFALSSFLFISCSQNEVFEQEITKETPLAIASAGVDDLTTRAIINGQLEGTPDANATLSVFVTDGSDDKYNAENVKWTHNTIKWYAESPTLYEGANSNQKICALSPYVENATADGVNITADGVSDYLIATSKLVTSNNVSLTMRHALAKLRLKPTFGTEAGGLDIASVEVKNMYASGTLNIKEDTWTGLSEATATLAMTNHEVLVIPIEVCESFPIVITMNDGRVFKATISLAAVDNELKSNSQYNIRLQIGQDKVFVGDITAAPWVAENGGNLETE